MSKFVSRAAYYGALIYSGATFQGHRGSLWDALMTRCGITDTNRVPVTATGVLALTQCGTLLVDATAGNIVLTFPPSGAAADEATYEVQRTDSSGNTVTFVPDGADTIVGATTVPAGGTIKYTLPAGSTAWRVQLISGATATAARKSLAGGATAARVDVATVAGTVDLTANAAGTDEVRFTGNLAVTKFTIAAGRKVNFVCSGTPTFANNANIVTQTGATLTLNAGDSGTLRATAADVVEVVGLSRAAGAVKGYMHLQIRLATGSSGGAAAVGDNARLMTTLVRNTIPGASMVSGRARLPPGTYRKRGVTTLYAVNQSRAYFKNITAAAKEEEGAQAIRYNTNSGGGEATVDNETDYAVTTDIELGAYCETGRATNGFGEPFAGGAAGTPEIYGYMIIEQVA